jgi:hypothetical protein
MFNEDLVNIMLNEYEAEFGGVSPTYHDIVQMRTLGNYDRMITNLPKRLKSLYIMNSTCQSIDISNCVSTLESLILDTTNIHTFPNIEKCVRLHTCKIMRSGLSDFSINYLLPESLNELNLESNHIVNIRTPNEFNYHALKRLAHKPQAKIIQLSGNCLSYYHFPEYLLARCNLIRQRTETTYVDDEPRVNTNTTPTHHDMLTKKTISQLNAQRDAKKVISNPTAIAASTVNNKQSVHLSSVNLSVQRSVKIMDKFISDNEIRVSPLTIPSFSLLKWMQYRIVVPSYPIAKPDTYLWHSTCHHYGITPVSSLQNQWNIKDVYSLTDKTYQQTFELIWAIMCFKYKRGEIKMLDVVERLMTECIDGRGYCFVGQYNRLVNSMVGIVDGVQIGFSENEQLQLNFAQLIARFNDKKITFTQLVEEANTILQTVEDPNVRDAWLSPIMDMAPEM